VVVCKRCYGAEVAVRLAEALVVVEVANTVAVRRVLFQMDVNRCYGAEVANEVVANEVVVRRVRIIPQCASCEQCK
jgi:hypothetical protein